MNILQTNLLSCILFSPLIGVLVLLFVPAKQEKLLRWVALAGSLIPLGLTVYAWVVFNQAPAAAFKLEEGRLFPAIHPISFGY